jgi:DHA1 family tetracycline resistance protein-like MFS transporter
MIGSLSPRYPFLLAALFNGLNLLLGYFVLPESHAKSDAAREQRNLLASLLSVQENRLLMHLLTIYFAINLIGQIPGSLWIINGEDRFGWDIRTVGATFAAFGILHAVAQAFLTGPATRRLGEGGAIILGVVSDILGFVAMAFAARGWMVFPILILFTAGGIAMPAIQSLLSRQVEEERQGQLQGALVSIVSLTEVAGPIVATKIYVASPTAFPGLVWLVGALLYLVCFPLIMSRMSVFQNRSAV